MAKDAQKFIGQNRAPRVQVEYDVELYGAEKKVNLPFVMGVLSDLSGDKVAAKVDGLKQLLEARQQLANLLSYMDGKSGAEELIAKLLADPSLLQALAAQKKQDSGADS